MNKIIISTFLFFPISILAEESSKIVNQVWRVTEESSSSSILDDERFYGVADEVEELTTLSIGIKSGEARAQRLRAYLVAPTTGEYQFSLSANDSAQFSLSPTSSKWEKQVLIDIPRTTPRNVRNSALAST